MANLTYIPVFDWTFFDSESERNAYREAYQIKDKYEIVASDNNGNILVLHKNKLYQIDHEVPTDKPYLLAKDYEALKLMLFKLCELKTCSIDTPLKEIKEVKKKLIGLRKQFPKELQDNFEFAIEEIAELISDYKFYRTKEGEKYLLTEAYREKVFTLLNKPPRYHYLIINRGFQQDSINISAMCTHISESIEEIERVMAQIEPPMEVKWGTAMSFEEYQMKLQEQLKGGNATNS